MRSKWGEDNNTEGGKKVQVDVSSTFKVPVKEPQSDEEELYHNSDSEPTTNVSNA